LAVTDSLASCRSGKSFFNLLEYFVDASVSESSESMAWRIMPRDELWLSLASIWLSMDVRLFSTSREWAVDVDKSGTEHSA
jgi:hypothetical protein